MSVLPEFKCTCVVQCLQKPEEDIAPLELVLRMVVTHLVGYQDQTLILYKSANARNHRAISLAPWLKFLPS